MDVDKGFGPARLVYAGGPANAVLRSDPVNRPNGRAAVPFRKKRHASLLELIFHVLCGPGMGVFYTCVFFLSVGIYGALTGGEYEAFAKANGEPADVLAKFLGFDIKAVTISGEAELTEAEVLAQAGISPRNSLIFLDAAKVRERLESIPLVKEVSVTKLYPDRLLIEIEERRPFALWQSKGHVHIIAADGTPLDSLRDDRFTHLPLVVGEGANAHIKDYLALLDAAGDFRPKIAGGIFVSSRRWNLKLTNGLEILLPEADPGMALAALVKLQREARVIDKDVLSLDFRVPGRMAARLSEDAATARAELLAKKPKTKGGQT